MHLVINNFECWQLEKAWTFADDDHDYDDNEVDLNMIMIMVMMKMMMAMMNKLKNCKNSDGQFSAKWLTIWEPNQTLSFPISPSTVSI